MLYTGIEVCASIYSEFVRNLRFSIDHFYLSFKKTTALVAALGSELLAWPVQQEQNYKMANKVEIHLFSDHLQKFFFTKNGRFKPNFFFEKI